MPETALGFIKSLLGKDLKPLPTNFVNAKILKVQPEKLAILEQKGIPYCDINKFNAQTMLRIAKYTQLDNLQANVEKKFKEIPIKKSAKNYEYVGDSDKHRVAIPPSFGELFYDFGEVINYNDDDLVEFVELGDKEYERFLNIAQAYGVVYQEVRNGEVSDLADVKNQEEIVHTAMHLKENSERIKTLLHDPAHFKQSVVNEKPEILNLSDPIEMARRIGMDKVKYTLLKDFFNGTAPIFKAMAEYVSNPRLDEGETSLHDAVMCMLDYSRRRKYL